MGENKIDEVVESKPKSTKNKLIGRIGMGVLSLGVVVGIILLLMPKITSVYNSYSIKSTLETALEGTKKLRAGYVISNYLDSPSESQSYLTVLLKDGSYTEYPIDSNGDIITDTSSSAVSDYVVFDWIAEDVMYTVNTSYTGNGVGSLWIEMPEDYADKSSNRDSMHLDWLLDTAEDFKSKDKKNINLGGVSVSADMYSFTLPADKVGEFMGFDTYYLYETLKEEGEDKDDESVVSLADTYLDELGMSLTYSKGQCEVGVVDGAIRYFKLEAGGLGTRMSLTKTLIQEDVGVRSTPDFSSCGNYYDDFKIFADYVKESGSLGDAIDNLRKTETSTDVKK